MDQSRIQEALGDRFRLDREVGRGGMAIVYRAFDARNERWVAIKILKPELVDASSAERFLREIRLEGRLQHPHILPIYESGSSDGFLFYVMPYVEGESLRSRLTRDGALAVEDAVRIARELADALASAHAQGIVHRDVKPGNVLLSGGHAVLADFGVARAVAESAGDRVTSSGIAVGTPTYMSPEQGEGDSRADARSDMYSLGCVLYEMLAGDPPYTGRTAAVVFAKHCAEPVPSLEVVRPGLPSELTQIVTRMLAKVPADRPAEGLLLAALDRSLAETQGAPLRTWLRGRVRSRRDVALRAIGVVATLAVMLALGWTLFRPDRVALDRNRVVVFPLANRSGADPDGGGMDLLIGAALDHTEPLRWFPGWNFLTSAERANGGSLDKRAYQRISSDLHAAYYLTGQVLKRPEEISVLLLLHDTRGDSVVAQAGATGALGIASENDVILEAIGKLLPGLVDPGRSVDLSLITDRAPAAIAAWVQGERSYRFSRFPEALSYYRRALEEDSLFTFAALKGAQAANWSHQPDQARAMLAVALRNDSGLSARQRLFLEGLTAYLEGAADTALLRLGGAVERDPQWSEAWMLMGEVHQHLLPRSVATDSAVTYFRRAAEDPGFTPPLIHLAEYAIREGRNAESRDLRRRLRLNGAAREVIDELDAMVVCVEDDIEAAAFPERARSNPKLVYDVAMLLAPGAQQAACASAAFEALLTADAWSSFYSWAAARGLQGLRVARGDAAGAERFLTTIVDSGAGSQNANLGAASNASLFLAVLNTIAGAPMPELTTRMESIARERYGSDYRQMRGVFTPWLLGSWHAFRKDTVPLHRLRDHLQATAIGRGDSAVVQLHADALTARIALLVDNDTTRTIRVLERLIASPMPADSVQNGIAVPFAPERLLLAQLHLARGDYRRALEVASAFDHPVVTIYLSFVPESLRIRRDGALALGNATLADHYTRRLRALGRVDQNDATR